MLSASVCSTEILPPPTTSASTTKTNETEMNPLREIASVMMVASLFYFIFCVTRSSSGCDFGDGAKCYEQGKFVTK